MSFAPSYLSRQTNEVIRTTDAPLTSARKMPVAGSTSNTLSNSSLPPRPKFAPSPCPYTEGAAGSLARWIPVISSVAHHPARAFETALEQMVLHPERSSGLILRAEVTSDTRSGEESSGEDGVPSLDYPSGLSPNDLDVDGQGSPDRWQVIRRIELNLLARKPGTDSSLRQSCLFLRRKSALPIPEHADESPSSADESAKEESLVLMSPLVENEEDVPHYHPPVRGIAFHWVPATEEKLDPEQATPGVFPDSLSTTAPQPLGELRISILPFKPFVPFPSSASSQDLTADNQSASASSPPKSTTQDVLPNRLYKTCLHLLETADKFAWGAVVGYQKRVQTDAIIDKAAFQDLYLILKSRHKHLDSRPAKFGSNQVVDVKRHVWKDVALAAFLMLLWKGMCPEEAKSEQSEAVESKTIGDEVVLPNGKRLQLRTESREWDAWGRPAGGFLDLGCGNGLLVHILVSEGYEGKGLELRSRRTWPTYPQRTQDRLIEHAIDPSSWFPTSLGDWREGEWEGRKMCPIGEGMFLIGNHADEMTPWIPLLSLIPLKPVPYLSLPCCLHTLSAMFTKSTFSIPADVTGSPLSITDEELGRGIDAGKYGAYVKWLGWVGVRCGWKWEKESLRIPSTRGWGIVARERWTGAAEQDWQCREYVLEEVRKVRTAGGFSVRKGEGSGHGGE